MVSDGPSASCLWNGAATSTSRIAPWSPAERSMHVAERECLYEEMHPAAIRQVGDSTSNRFTSDAAEKTGKFERSN